MVNKLLTIKEAAKLLRIHEITLYRMANSGDIPSLKVGKQWRFEKEKLLKSFERKGYDNKRKK